jgi:hypothetical protein
MRPSRCGSRRASAIQRNFEEKRLEEEAKVKKQWEESNARQDFTHFANLYQEYFQRHRRLIDSNLDLSSKNDPLELLRRSITAADPSLHIVERKTPIGRNAEFKESDEEYPTACLRTPIGNIALFCVRYHLHETPTLWCILGFSTDKKNYYQLSSNKMPLDFNSISLLDSEIEEAMEAILASQPFTQAGCT